MSGTNEVITKEMVEKQGLTMEEYEMIKKKLGREPNYTELGMFSAMWSEHCSYKNSKPVLKLFPTKGKQVIQGPGENAGVVDIGDGLGVVFKIESHNHPSAVEPYAAAATGGGGCIRDIFTMGARPIGLLDSLRLGRLENGRVKFLFKNIIKGFTDYANEVGIPVMGGEIYFDESFEGNPLVNAMTVGIVKNKAIVKARASGIGNLVLIVGGPTGTDGVEGAAFASAGLDEAATQKSSAVAIGDPKMGRILRESCLELMGKGLVIGMQDMGAAGLTCSTSETAYKAKTGMEIDIALIPRKSENMSPYEVMLSESQERMLVIVDKDKLEEVQKVFAKWNVPVDLIGKVTDDGMVRVKDNGEVVAEVPAAALVEAPVYHRKTAKPKYLAKLTQLNLARIKQPKDLNGALKKLLANPTIASKAWVFKHGDPKVGKNILLGPGCSDAGVAAVPQTKKAIAATADCNSVYCLLDPFKGGAIAVAEAARNLVCTGAKPLAITDGINFGNPKNPEVFWQFKQAALGISKACLALNTPVVSGNVSFNNENPKGSVDPTPIVGMVGLIKDRSKIVTQYFKQAGDVIILLGKNKEELGASEYLKTIHGLKQGKCPDIDLKLEKSVQKTALEAIEKDLVRSAHDCSEGGLAVAIAESCISSPKKKLGAVIAVKALKRNDALLFGESQSRIILSAKPKDAQKILKLAKKNKTPAAIIGEVKGTKLVINKLINASVNDLARAWSEAIEKQL